MAPALPTTFPNEDRGEAAIAVFWSLTAIATLVVGLRFYSRWLIGGIKLDDWFILFTLCLFAITSGLVTDIALHGGYRHLIHVPVENAMRVARGNLLGQCFNVVAFGTGKFSVGLLLLHVLSKTSVKRKWFIWVLISVTLIYNLVEGILMMFQCDPAESAWDLSEGRCWTLKTKLINIYVGGVYNIITDAILALLPLTVIPSLKMSVQNRVRLSVLLGLGLFAAICGSIKLSYAHTLKNLDDITWGTYELVVWSGAELFVIIVCSSIPPLNVLWQRIANKGSLTQSRQSYYPGSGRTMGTGEYRQFKILQANPGSTTPDEEALPLGRIEAVTEVRVSSIHGADGHAL